MTTTSSSTPEDSFTKNFMDVAIRFGVLVLWASWCFKITRPFLDVIVWGIIIAVAIHPAYKRVTSLLGGRPKLAAALVTIALLLILVGPAVPLTIVLVENVHTLAEDMRDGTLAIPPPPEGVETWPLVGKPLAELWDLAHSNLESAIQRLGPEIKAAGSWLLQAGAGVGFGVLQFLLAVIISGLLLVNAGAGHQLSLNLCKRLAGEKGSDLVKLAEATVRSVARGVIGVSVLQALLAGLGLIVAGVPAAGLWALVCLILCIVHIGAIPVMLPAAIYVFATGETVTAVLFLIWSVFVSTIDNILGPLIMGRGVDVPMAVIFVGAIGGMMVSGIIGLFVGPIILALGYKLFKGWLDVRRDATSGDAVST